jgi:hypothetical protein
MFFLPLSAWLLAARRNSAALPAPRPEAKLCQFQKPKARVHETTHNPNPNILCACCRGRSIRYLRVAIVPLAPRAFVFVEWRRLVVAPVAYVGAGSAGAPP